MRALSIIAALLLLTGCSGPFESDFPVVVQNFSPGAISVFADGVRLGDLPAASTRAFKVHLAESGFVTKDAAGNLTSPTPTTTVTFTAVDVAEGFPYPGATGTISQDESTFVEFRLVCPEDVTKRCTVSSRIVNALAQ